ncbi:MAG: electron transport complex subunit RsxG [Woeseiaceae bacterium]|nr:electron transport complex subunit RsxG [Woeseiaceae bacterium]
MSDHVAIQDRQPTALQNGLILAAVAAICTTLVALTFNVTKERIAANEQEYLRQSLAPVLADVSFDNDIEETALTIPAPHVLPGTEDAIIYPLFNNNQPVAALFVVTAENGFSGPIRLLIGIDFNGNITGVRALEHNETPGIGDGIEISRSDWIEIFRGKSLDNPNRAAWSIKRDGGAFDQLTGASVTSRAVVGAIDLTLRYFEVRRNEIFANAAGSSDE